MSDSMTPSARAKHLASLVEAQVEDEIGPMWCDSCGRYWPGAPALPRPCTDEECKGRPMGSDGWKQRGETKMLAGREPIPVDPIASDYQAVFGTPPPEVGRKNDAGKRRWSLLPFLALGAVVDVLTFGATKYAPNNWQIVPNAAGPQGRYADALLRHVAAWQEGEDLDPETGIHHLAHAVCNGLFALHFELKEQDT